VVEALKALYLPVLLGTASVLLALEWLSTWQRRPHAVSRRWSTNLGLYALVWTVSWLVLPAGIVAFSSAQASRVLSDPSVPPWAGIITTILLLDLYRYWEHRIFHRIPLLWHMHLVHHSDTRLDITTTERHHPFETLLSLCFLLLFILLLAPPPEGILCYYLLALPVSLYSHANIRLPTVLERLLGTVLVTPALHSLHHSDQQNQTDSNYGALLILWDRAFATLSRPGADQQTRFGLEYFHRAGDQGLVAVLMQPLRYLPGMDYQQREDVAVDISDKGQRHWQYAALLVLSGSLLLVSAFPEATSSITRIWHSAGAWQYAWLVLPTFAYLLLGEYRQELLAKQPRPGWEGLLLAVPAALLMLAGEVLDINLARHLALVLCIQALILSAVGRELFYRCLPLWCLLFLAVPYSDLVLPALRQATLWSIEAVAVIVGLPFESQGFKITLAGNDYVIVDACAGVGFFTLAVFLCYSLGVVLYRRFWAAVAMAAAGGVMAMLANFLRVNAIVLTDLQNGTQASLDEHRAQYWLALAILLGLLGLLVTQLKPDSPKQLPPSDHLPCNAHRWAPGMATLALCLLPSLTGSSANVMTGQVHFAPPISLQDYARIDAGSSWHLRDDGASRFSTARYAKGATAMAVAVELPLNSGLKLDAWRVLPDEPGDWTRGRRDHRQTCDGYCSAYLHHTWRDKGNDRLYNIYAAYLVGGELTTSQLRLRWERALAHVRGDPGHGAAILSVLSDDPIDDPIIVANMLLELQRSLALPNLRQ
jgi:exosortase